MIGEPEEMISHLHSKSRLSVPFASHSLFTSKQKRSSRALREIQVPDESAIGPRILTPTGNSMSARLIIVEGNIGVGKTTLATSLSTELSCKVFIEPAVENPYLERFYKDPHRFALALQLWILQQRYQTYVDATKHIINTGEDAVLDRSVFSDIVFANVCHREGYITDNGYKKYMYWREKAVKFLPIPHVTLFLNAPPDCCLQRIKNRGRECENGVPIDYLKKLHYEYLHFCENMKKLGSTLVQRDWCRFQLTSNVKGEIMEQPLKKWSCEVVQQFTERHSSSTELLPVSELQAACE